MKKFKIFLGAMVIVATTLSVSSCGSDNGSDTPPVIAASKIKTISINDGYAIESWEFSYNSKDRVASISNVYDGGTPEIITYDYSVANKLTINKGGNKTNYVLDDAGRVIKELWDADGTEWQGFEYNSDGIMTKVIEHYSGSDHLKYTLTIAGANVASRSRFGDDGVTKSEERIYKYGMADNLSDIPQIYTIDSEWKNIGGTFGKTNKKLLTSYTRKITSEPNTPYEVNYTYTFDSKNRVATQTKSGISSGGPFSESWAYTYYED